MLKRIYRLPKTVFNILLKLYYRGRITSPYDFHFGYKDLLKENSRFNNKYSGRCFILGNGPSLGTNDLTPLKDEYVFALNSIVYTKVFEDLKPKFYVTWDDINFDFEDPDIGDHRLELFNRLSEYTPNSTLVFPVKQKKVIEELRLLNKDNILWTYWGAKWDSPSIDADFQKQIPYVNEVLQIAILSALYMGFKDIYILGADFTNFLKYFEYHSTNTLDKKYMHFYEEDEKELEVLNKVVDYGESNESRLRTTADKLMIYRNIGKLSNKYGAKIINLTNGGGLDVYERGNYEDVVKENLKR